MTLLAFRDVTCARGGRTLFAGLSFALAPGEAAVVTGANGVGKSSLIRIAAGLLAPANGTIDVGGPRALLAEAAALDRERTVAAALTFWAKLDGGADPAGRVATALIDVGLAGLAEVPVRLLSTGQRHRIAFGRVVASAAPVWLLDEPANGLDTSAVAQLEALVARHRAGGGVAIVTTHLRLAMPEAMAIDLGAGV